MKILITGSSGLIGGEAVEYFDSLGHTTIGVDNNMRMEFFGAQGDTGQNLHRIFHKTKNFTHSSSDIRNMSELVKYVFDVHAPFDAVIHCAAQPSHDKAKDIPIVDFEVNALGTLNLLELTRQYCPDAAFVFMSTNKVYGDAPNEIPMAEFETRYDYTAEKDYDGVKETMRIDQSTHSVFGASKVSADIMVQEYGRYFGMKTCVLRGGCLTGPSHSGVELHGFLSYLVKCVMSGRPYKVFGYNGKQVRDNIHSYDVIRAIEEIIKNPRPGSVYNIGGGRENSVSIIEAIEKAEKFSNKKLEWSYDPTNRIGDHICYITDMSKFKKDYPDWQITKSIDRIFMEIVGSNNAATATERYMPGDGGDGYFDSYASVIKEKCYGNVLDIGCGHGYLTYQIAEKENVTHVIGTDVYDGYRIPHSKIHHMIVDTEKMMNDKNCDVFFDVIVSTEHIEHLNEELHSTLLKWITKHLSDDGIFTGSMPFPDDVDNKNPYHIKTYTIDEWNDVLKRYFHNVKITKCENHDVYCWSASTVI